MSSRGGTRAAQRRLADPKAAVESISTSPNCSPPGPYPDRRVQLSLTDLGSPLGLRHEAATHKESVGGLPVAAIPSTLVADPALPPKQTRHGSTPSAQ
jgi:hypothetical protein